MNLPIIYVVSDSVGETAELVTKAAITQFNGSGMKIKTFPFVEDEENIAEVISLIKLDQAMVAYTLVKPEMRKHMKEQSEQEGIIAIDLMGPLMDEIQRFTGKTPL